MKKIQLGGHRLGSPIKAYALVDDRDYPWLSKIKWSAHKQRAGYYATCVKKGAFIRMHRLIMKYPPGKVVDHIDGNTLNNQRKNLRICTHSQNQMNIGLKKNNTSGFKGVSFDKKSNKYRAAIQKNGHKKMLGLFDTPEEAYRAYIQAAKRVHGSYAHF